MADTEQHAPTDDELAGLFGRFFAPLYDVAVRVLASDADAGVAVGRAFGHAFVELRRGPVEELRPWLFGLLAAELPRRRAPTEADLGRFAQLDPDRLAAPERLGSQVVEAIWSEAAALVTEDYLLLDLRLRHGLRDAELARALGLDFRVVDRRLERLRDRLEEAVESPISPVAVFAALAPVPPPVGLKERVWASLAEAPPPRASR